MQFSPRDVVKMLVVESGHIGTSGRGNQTLQLIPVVVSHIKYGMGYDRKVTLPVLCVVSRGTNLVGG